MGITVGMKGVAETLCEREDTAKEVGSGDLLVYATPCMVALMEGAACDAVAEGLSEDQTTVGTALNIEHISATPVGWKSERRPRSPPWRERSSPLPSVLSTKPVRSVTAPTSAWSSTVRNFWTRHTASCKEVIEYARLWRNDSQHL